MATLEQVERLREKTGVSYDLAKEALDATNGDLLEAIIYLERQGKAVPPAGGGFYTSASQLPPPSQVNGAPGQGAYEKKSSGFMDLMRKFFAFLIELIHKGNRNSIEVIKGGEMKASVPVTVLALLLIFAFWVTIPVMVVGLFFGLRYRFTGPDLGSDAVNSAMDSAADAAENIKRSVSEK